MSLSTEGLPPPYLAVLILNYNGCEDTLECVKSVLGGWRGEYELVVIDNASTDDSVKKLRAWAEDQCPLLKAASGPDQRTFSEGTSQRGVPRLTLLEAPSNLGFAGGNNVGIRYALARGATWILILNNDTIVERGTLPTLVEGAERAGADLAGCSIYEYGDPTKPWYFGGIFHWWGGRTITSLRSVAKSQVAVETDWITGCCLIVRRRVFEKIGLLDERAFLYYEDEDFCQRAAQAGFKRVVVLGARIYHKVSQSSGVGSPLMYYHATMSRTYFHRKHHRFVSHVAFLALFLLRSMARSLLWSVEGRWDLVDATWRALRDSYWAGNKTVETVK